MYNAQLPTLSKGEIKQLVSLLLSLCVRLGADLVVMSDFHAVK